jgi:hypothetical protein
VVFIVFREQSAIEFIFLFTVLHLLVVFDGSSSTSALGAARDSSIFEPAVGTLGGVAYEGNTGLQDQRECVASEVASTRGVHSPLALDALGEGSVDAGLVASYGQMSATKRRKL